MRYIADKFGSPGIGLTRSEAIHVIQGRDIPQPLIREVDEMLEQLEAAEYSGTGDAASNGDGRPRIRKLIDALEAIRTR